MKDDGKDSLNPQQPYNLHRPKTTSDVIKEVAKEWNNTKEFYTFITIYLIFTNLNDYQDLPSIQLPLNQRCKGDGGNGMEKFYLWFNY